MRTAVGRRRSGTGNLPRLLKNLSTTGRWRWPWKGRSVTLGPEPLLGYLVAKEMQQKDLHILFSGLRAGQAEADIRFRLRELYP